MSGPAKPPAPRLALSIEEAAAAIGVGRSSFYELVLPHVRTVSIGRRIVIQVAELDAYLDRHAQRATLDDRKGAR